MTSERLRKLKKRLDRLVGEIDEGLEDEEATPEEQAVLDEAVAAFRAAGPELLDQATEQLWAYYRDTWDALSPEDRLEWELPELADGDDIWAEVDIELPPARHVGGTRLEPDRAYLDFEGSVSWEAEHGLQLVFALDDDGLRVGKVGPYDGHVTQAHAWGDESLLGVVFKGS